MIPLRPYQEDIIEDVRCSVRNGHTAVCLQSATGSGKTVICAGIAASAQGMGSKVMAVVHRAELVDQFHGTLESAGIERVGVIAPKRQEIPWANFHVASVFSLVRRKKLNWLDPDIIFWDEAHHVAAETWMKTVERFPRAIHIGPTATPVRGDGKGLGEVFTDLVCGPSIAELVDMGYLAPMRVLRAPVGMAKMREKAKILGGDYNRGELDKQVGDAIVAKTVESYQAYTPGRKAIFFGLTIRHSRLIAESFRKSGISAEHVDGNTPDGRRREIMRRFAEGDLAVVCNVDLISEGFDAPSCEVVIDAQHTKSLGRYMQKAGRAMRTAPGKEDCVLLDLCGNSYELGLPDEDRTWTLSMDAVSGEPDEQGKPKDRLKVCGQCSTVFPSRRTDCPACGAEHISGQTIAEADVELREAKKNGGVGPKRRNKPSVSKNTINHELAKVHRMRPVIGDKKAYQMLQDVGKRFGYKQGWVTTIANLHGIEPDG